MDNFMNILRQVTTPKEGVSSEDTYNNGAGFLNPLAWKAEEGYEPEGFVGDNISVEYDLRNGATLGAPEETPSYSYTDGEGYADWVYNEESTTPNYIDSKWKNNDGVVYGVGDDGKTYKYGIDENGYIKDLTALDQDEQRKIINDLTSGKIKIDKSITNNITLDMLYDAISRVKNYDDGSLIPDKIKMFDLSSEFNGRDNTPSNVAGFYTSMGDIFLKDTDDPVWNVYSSEYSGETGHNAKSKNIDSTPIHELGHGTKDTVDYMLDKRGPNSLLERLRLAKEMPTNQDSLYYRAANESGFGEDLDKATESVSKYATTDLHEAFAEAFADVLVNGDDAATFSKRLVDLYSQESKGRSKKLQDYFSEDPFNREAQLSRLENILRDRS